MELIKISITIIIIFVLAQVLYIGGDILDELLSLRLIDEEYYAKKTKKFKIYLAIFIIFIITLIIMVGY